MLMGQLLLGLINGAFYALLSVGLAIIFGLLNIINFTHGALYMMGAFVAWLLLTYLGIGYWPALILAPLFVGIFGMVLERTPSAASCRATTLAAAEPVSEKAPVAPASA